MNVKTYFQWLIDNWARTGVVLAVYLTVFLIVLIRPVNFPLFLILLQTPLYLLHETEEYVFPGGFGKFFNRHVFHADHDDKPLGRYFIFVINMIYIWILLPLFGLLSAWDIRLGLWIPYFIFFAGLSHIALAIKARNSYNPGLIISLVLNIPVGMAVVIYFEKIGLLTSYIGNTHFFIGLGGNLLLPVLGALTYKRYKRRVSE